jgi:hypothetical protein
MLTSPAREPVGPNDERWNAEIPEQSQQTPSASNLNLQDTIYYGRRLLDELASDIAFRWQYYKISRTWHEGETGGVHGGEFGRHWCALTSGDVDTDAPGNPDHPHGVEIGPSGPENQFSYHWPPNDSSYLTYTLPQLGLNPVRI